MAIIGINYLPFKGPLDFDTPPPPLSDYCINIPPLHEVQKYEVCYAL